MTKMLMLAALKGNTAAGKVTQFFHYSHYSFETFNLAISVLCCFLHQLYSSQSSDENLQDLNR